jgi:hypothetical protein
MKVRYLTRQNRVTQEQVEQYAREHNESWRPVKQQLENKVGPVLQYWDEENQTWVDAESVTEYRE